MAVWTGICVAVFLACHPGKSRLEEALEAARWSDVDVLCLGEMMTWSGENASRSSIALPQIQEELAKELKKAGKPIVLG